MSNSPLVSHVRLSPNYSRRTTNNIDRITPHHVAGVVSIETLGGIFVPVSRKASSTYGIGYDGRVGLFVDEANRPWTSSSRANDDQAITIEVSNSQVGGQWPVSDAAYKSLVNLCVDICQRHGKKKLLFLGDKGTTLAYRPKPDEMVLTMHKWFYATSCPGPYLESKFPQLAKEVTSRLGNTATTNSTNKKETPKMETIRKGPGKKYQVGIAQSILIHLGYLSATVNGAKQDDGIFGARTELAVRAFQKAKGLVVDGIVGPKTWNALLGVA